MFWVQVRGWLQYAYERDHRPEGLAVEGIWEVGSEQNLGERTGSLSGVQGSGELKPLVVPGWRVGPGGCA